MSNYGQPKWIIQPLGYKVRLRKKPFDNKDEELIAEIDYAGYDVLMNRLRELRFIADADNYISNEGDGDIKEFSLETLDPDWKTTLMDFFRDMYGTEEMTCEVEPSHYDDLEESIRKKTDGYLRKHNPEAFDEKGNRLYVNIWDNDKGNYVQKAKWIRYEPSQEMIDGWKGKWCSSHGRGKIIPLFLGEYYEAVEWIEKHLKTEESKKDGRGKNPNSLKNLKHFHVDVVDKK